MRKICLKFLFSLLFLFNSGTANERLIILRGEDAKERLKKTGFNAYTEPEIFEALLEYNSVKKFDEDIGLMIPPLKCLEKGKPMSAFCAFGFSRSLSYLDDRFKGMKDEKGPINFLDEMAEVKRDFRLLELGAGIGVLLIEAQVRYPYSKVVGINYEPHLGVEGEADLKRVALFHQKSTSAQWQKLKNKPALIFKDLNQGDMSYFSDSYFDVVLSQSTLQYLARKDILLKEIYRVLSAEGRAYLDLKNIRVDENKSALQSFMLLVDGLIKHNSKIKIFAPKGFSLIIIKPAEKDVDELVVPFRFIRTLAAKEVGQGGSFEKGDSEGVVTHFKSIQ